MGWRNKIECENEVVRKRIEIKRIIGGHGIIKNGSIRRKKKKIGNKKFVKTKYKRI